ncbi:transmembrane protein 179B-like [Crassostrea virginica]|uniref:Transmembrane protein 179B-like n=1 Tax=Crassostrea virginica TaxID=6565 RepID=A0A8B8DQJ4_CRAVI|nr:transmembrane protein 179B-like [Crassostrea virginica]
MAVSDVQLVVNTLLYYFIFVCGFAISIPIGVTTIEASGRCLLYSTIKPVNATLFTTTPGQKGNCDFPIYVGVFGCIFYGLGMGIYNSYAIYKSRNDPSIASQMWVMPFILTNSLVSAIMFVCSCIISVGFKELCDGLTTDKPYKYFSSCSQAQKVKLILLGTEKTASLKHFYDYINVTQTASWICTLGWIVLVVSGIIRFALNRRLRAGGSSTAEDKIATIEPTA